MATDWEEIKKLAADFQRAQLSTSAQKLSEKNCVEIIQKIIELKLLDVIYTSDGKEYLTPEHLGSEISDELFIHGGRIHLTDLAQILNVDFNHVESKASDLVNSSDELHLVLGQLINNDYLDHLAEEVNEKLHQEGQISIGSLTKLYDLPGEFLQQVIDDRFGSIIQAQYDPFDHRMLFTPSFVARHKAQISGALTALTRPTAISSILIQYGLQERLFYSITDELMKTGRLPGFIQGARQDRASYVPELYSKSQNEYVDTFYNQNKYLEYDSLVRLGISDPVNYIKKRYKDQDLFYLKTCCIGKQILEQMDGAIDDAISTGSWVDVMPLLPSILNTKDGNILLQSVMKSKSKSASSTNAHIFCESVLVSPQLVDDCMKTFDPLMMKKAAEDMKQGVHLKLNQQAEGLLTSSSKVSDKLEEGKKDKKDERRKRAAGGKAGGGAQGRETKTKSVKKKFHKGGKGGDDSDSDDDGSKIARGSTKSELLQFMNPSEIETEISKLELLEECSPELIHELANYMYRPLIKMYENVAKSVFEASSISSVSRKKSHDELQEKLIALITNTKLFEKGIACFPDDVETLLTKHLLKTTCTDILNLIFVYLASEHIPDITQGSSLTAEVRQKYINKLPNKLKEPIQKIHSSLNLKDTVEFYDGLDIILGPEFCDVVVKNVDKKKERQIIFNHRQALLNQLSESSDYAIILHIAVLILHQTFSGCMLQASGKFVPQIIKYLESKIPADASATLQQYQVLVIQSIKCKDTEEAAQCNKQLDELVTTVKGFASTLKNTSTPKDN